MSRRESGGWRGDQLTQHWQPEAGETLQSLKWPVCWEEVIIQCSRHTEKQLVDDLLWQNA